MVIMCAPSASGLAQAPPAMMPHWWAASNSSLAPTASAISRTAATGCGKRFRSEEHTSELQSLMRISYAVFCLKKKKKKKNNMQTQPAHENDHNKTNETYERIQPRNNKVSLDEHR